MPHEPLRHPEVGLDVVADRPSGTRPDAGPRSDRRPGTCPMAGVTERLFASAGPDVTGALGELVVARGFDGGAVSRVRRGALWAQHAVDGRGTCVHVPEALPPGDCPCRLVLRSSAPVVIGSCSERYGRDHWTVRTFGIETYVGAPVRIEGVPVGTLALWSRDRRAMGPAAAEEVAVAARLFGAAIEREERRRLLGDLQRVARVGAWSLDADSEMMQWSEGAFLIHGRPSSLGHPTVEEALLYVVPPHRERVREAVRRPGGGCATFDLEAQIVTHTGEARWVRIRGECQCRDGGPERTVGTIVDVHDLTEARLRAERAEMVLRTVVDNSPSVVYAKDRDGRYLLANHHVAALAGRPKDEVIGRTDAELWSPEHASRFRQEDELVLRTEESLFIEDSGGPRGDVLTSKYPVRDDSGCVVGVAGIGTNIGPLKALQRQLEESRRRFELATEAAGVGVWTWNVDDDRLTWSGPMRRLLGLAPGTPPSTLAGFIALLHPDDRAAAEERIRAAADRVAGFEGEFRVRDLTGHRVLATRGMGYAARGVDPRRVAGACWDVTSQHEAEASVRRVNTLLSERNAELEQFLYTISHDLKAPVVTIEGFAGLASARLDGGGSPEVVDAIERIRRATARLSAIIGELIQLSTIGRNDHPAEPVDVGSLLDELLADMDGLIVWSRAEVIVATPMPTLRLPRSRLRQALENLIGNALHHGLTESDRRIIVEASRDHAEVRIGVRDHGPGIPPEFHARIFEPFVRLQPARDGGESRGPAWSGTGVGLAIVRRVALALGGRVLLHSDPGCGATFTLALPVTLLSDTTPEEHPR